MAKEEFLHGKRCQTLVWAVQGGGGITIPRDVQEMTGCGTWVTKW